MPSLRQYIRCASDTLTVNRTAGGPSAPSSSLSSPYPPTRREIILPRPSTRRRMSMLSATCRCGGHAAVRDGNATERPRCPRMSRALRVLEPSAVTRPVPVACVQHSCVCCPAMPRGPCPGQGGGSRLPCPRYKCPISPYVYPYYTTYIYLYYIPPEGAARGAVGLRAYKPLSARKPDAEHRSLSPPGESRMIAFT